MIYMFQKIIKHTLFHSKTKKLAPMDGELSKVSVDIQFDPERSFAACP